MCPKCTVVLEKEKRGHDKHTCGDLECVNCHQFFNEDHMCYMMAKQLKKKRELKHMYFDFECSQFSGEHNHKIVRSQTIYDLCEEQDLPSNIQCPGCRS